jgi:hypothetical protein
VTDRAPLAIFVYKRPEHARRMLESVLMNAGARDSPIYVFCDGARSAADAAEVARTREVVQDLAPARAEVVERDANLGLARSIIAGVSMLADRYGKVVVLEDDLVLSPLALDYFNAALERYRDVERVMHVSGYMYPVKAALPESFFYREATCWGWATWARAWKDFEPDGKKIRRFIEERGLRHEFDAFGSMPFFRMLNQQISGRIDSWAIRWYGSLRMHDGLALHPGRSLIQNKGHDGTGEHTIRSEVFDVTLAAAPVGEFPQGIEESRQALAAIIEYRNAVRWNQRAALVRAAVRGLLSRST